MDTFKRTIGTLFVPSGFHRSLLLATYDDSFMAEEGELECEKICRYFCFETLLSVLVQTLLGCDSKTSANDAKGLFIDSKRIAIKSIIIETYKSILI